MRKAQIEMMGLVIIVILLTLGLFFSVALKKPKTGQTLPSVYTDEKMASDLLITFLETSVDSGGCYGVTFRDLAIDCARLNQSGYGNYDCGDDSCTVLNNSLNQILDETLNSWDYNYNLTYVYEYGGESTYLTMIDDHACQKVRCEETAPGIQPISLYQVLPGQARFELHIYQ